VGEEKVRRVRERFDLRDYVRLHAHGDTSEDRALPSPAHERWYRGRRLAPSPD